jgi:hypothetical protein
MRSFLLLALVCFLVASFATSSTSAASGSRPSLKALLSKTNVVAELDRVGKFVERARRVAEEHELTQLTFECTRL